MHIEPDQKFPAYIHVQEVVDAYVGPFVSAEAVKAHVEFWNKRGDLTSPTLRGLDLVLVVPEGEFTLSSEMDCAVFF